MNFFKAKPRVSTNEADIDLFLSRGLENVFPGKDMLKKALMSGKRLSFYLGIDPTGPTLHMGHAIPMAKLAELQALGHDIILLMGDFTAMIGDPTDKSATRKRLTRAEVLKNLASYKKQAQTFLSFSGKNPARIEFNSTWLGKMSFSDVVDLASHTTVQQMLERDMFEKRLEEKKPIYLHEFLYPLMQGYDSVALDVDGEIGGNDQTFNMLSGRDLLKVFKNKEKFVIATRLLVDPTGKKMGKSEGNMITMADSARDMFGKVMSWPDSMIISGFELCTRVPLDQIEKEKESIASGANPRDAKIHLASAVVEIYHGIKEANKAREDFFTIFSKKSIPEDAKTVTVDKNTSLCEILKEQGLVASNTEYRRLVAGGSIKNIKTGDAIEHIETVVTEDIDIRVGKTRFLRIKVK